MAKYYYVRRHYTDTDYQKGAFEILDNAKKCCNKYPGYNVYDCQGNLIYTGPSLTNDYIINDAVSWAKYIASDNSHGYDNRKGHRGGSPDYACSSYVNESYRQAGVNLPKSESVYTAKIRSIYIKAGFKDVTSQVNFSTKKGLKKGDILLTPGQHVELYIGSGKIAGARGNASSGKSENGKPGDQTGHEIEVSNYYNFPWKYCLRYVGHITKEKYIVQCGIFCEKNNALKLIEKLKQDSFNAVIKTSGSNYIVQTGLFKDRSNATTLVNNLNKKGYSAIIKEL